MLNITFQPTTVAITQGFNITGQITDTDKKVVCTVTLEFLNDISGGGVDYEQILYENRFTIENIAEDKLNTLSEAALGTNPIKITINAADVKTLNI